MSSSVSKSPASPLTHRTLFWSVYLPSFLLASASGMLIPTLPLYARSLGLSFQWVSLVIAAAGFGTLLFDVPSGLLMGRVGRRITMIAGAGSLVVTAIALGFSTQVSALIFFRLLSGMGSALWSISRHSYIAEEVPPGQRGRALAMFGGVQRIGTFVGPVIGGIIGQLFGLNAPFFVYAGVALVATILAALFVPESSGRRQRGARGYSLGTIREILRLHHRELSTAGAAQVFGQMIRAGRQILIPLYANDVLLLDVGAVGTIISASSAIDMLLFYPAGLIMDRFGRRFATIPSFFLLSIGMGLVPFTSSYLTLLGAVLLIGFGNGIGSGSMMTLGADLAPKDRISEFLGVWRLIGDAGSTGGPVVVGAIADAAGLAPAALALCGVGLLSVALFATIVRETHRPRQPAPV